LILLMLATVTVPLLMTLLLFVPPVRQLIIRSLGAAPAPALLLLPGAWEGRQHSFVLSGGWILVWDQPGALMLSATAILWCIGGFAASKFLADRADAPRFALWWLLTLTGSVGVFIAGDVASFYLFYALASLPAYGLIVFDGDVTEQRAGRYALVAALLGEGLILAAFVMLVAAANGESIAIESVIDAMSAATGSGLMFTLLILGFGLKIGLVPLHGWMPMSYAAGPLVAAAVLSGATSKAGIIGLIRFLPLDSAFPFWGNVLLSAGLVSAFYGVILGLTQTNARSVLAYSSISQLGQMAAVLGAGMTSGIPGAATPVAFYAVFHILTKGGLFLALGMKEEGERKHRWGLLLTALMALGFAGMPLTGGSLGKIAVKQVIGSGLTSFLFSVAAIGSTLLMLHFVRLLHQRGKDQGAPHEMAIAWGASAIAATILPWGLFSNTAGLAGLYALNADVLLDLTWPIAVGVLLAWLALRIGITLPVLPPGDMMEPAMRRWDRTAERLSLMITNQEGRARQWHVSSIALVLVLIAMILLLSRV
jgi:formate hydrogenlyase subunit 3/multisubunit Na+/H+ antiporter MnhD subunit